MHDVSAEAPTTLGSLRELPCSARLLPMVPRSSRFFRLPRGLAGTTSEAPRAAGPGAARVSPTAASWAEEARPMTVSWVTPIASGSSRAGIAGIWAGPETEVTGRPRSSVSCCAGPLRGVEGQAPFPRLPPGTAVRDRSQTAGGLAGWGLRGPARWPSPGRLGRPSGCTPLRGTSRAHALLHFAHPLAPSPASPGWRPLQAADRRSGHAG